jgi:DNA-binding response OmpR family regulator
MDKRPRALVADDDVAIRVLIARILIRSGFDVDSVRDGAEAIEHVLANEYAVVVLDLMMPRMDGFAVIDYLNRRSPELLKRVIVLTAFGAGGTDTIKSLVNCCIEKPFEVATFAKRAKLIVEPPAAQQPPDETAAVPETDTARQLDAS